MVHNKLYIITLLFCLWGFEVVAKDKLPISVKQKLLAQDYQAARPLLQTLSAGGNSEAQYQLALLYLNERIEADDGLKTAEHWLTKAALSNGRASYLLGSLYAKGERLDKDMDKARKWLSLAKAQGHANADRQLKHLGLIESNKNVVAKKMFEAVAQGDITSLVSLLSQGHRFDIVNDYGETLLHVAIGKKQRAIAVYLIGRAEGKLNISQQDNQGYTALHLTIRDDDIALSQQLVNKNADLGVKDAAGLTPLAYAKAKEMKLILPEQKPSRDNKAQLVNKQLLALMEQASDKDSPYFGWSKLSIAVAQGQQRLVEHLLESGHKVWIGGLNSPLSVALAQKEQSIALQLLNRLEVNEKTTDIALLPLWYQNIIRYQQMAAFAALSKKLTEAMPDAVVAMPMDKSPLMFALHYQRPEFIAAFIKFFQFDGRQLAPFLLKAVKSRKTNAALSLLEYGAGFGEPDADGRGVLWYAADTAQDALIESLLNKQAKAEIDIADHQGFTPLMRAVIQNCYQCAAILLLNGADLTLQTKTGNNALFFAAQGKYKILKLLLKPWPGGKADPSIRNQQSLTPLMVAVQQDCVKCVSALIKAGANPYRKNEQGQNAFDMALGDPRLTRVLNR